MTNQITASVDFYFKGKKFSAFVELDVDRYMNTTGELPALYPLLSQSINCDLYSYEYEMLQTETILFSKAKGLISHYVKEGALDFDAFKTAWSEEKILRELQEVAQRTMSVKNIQLQPDLKNALLEAYQLGANKKNKT